MNKQLFVSALLAALLLSTAAHAQDRWPRWYVGLSGGVTYLQDSDLDGTTSGDVSFDNGWSGNVQLGYLPAFGGGALNNLRFEGEVGYRSNDADTLRFGGTGGSASDNISATTYMVNALYDIDMGTPYKPYVGAGIGVADLKLKARNAAATFDSGDSAFAWQLLAGVGFAPASTPNVEWDLGYRFLRAESVEFTSNTGVNVDADYDSHSVEAGAKFRF